MKNLCIVLALSLGLLAQEASAFVVMQTSGCRSGRLIKSRANNFYPNEVSFPTGSVWEYALRDVLDDYGPMAGSSWYFQYAGRDLSSQIGENGINQVAFVAGSAIDHAPGMATWYYDYDWHIYCSYIAGIKEVDIKFNADESWNPYYFVSSGYSLRAVALHEFGHALGLKHESRTVATMGSGSYAYFGWSSDEPLFQADDRAGMRYLYPDSASGEHDLAVLLYKQSSTSGEYGSTSWTDQSFSAVQGGTFSVEYTFENLGTYSSTVDVDFYIWVNGSPRWLGTSWINSDGGATGTFTRYLTLPSDIAPGSYPLSIEVDPISMFADVARSNNVVKLRNNLTVQPPPICGDGRCASSAGETCYSPSTGTGCQQDCGTCAYCGDGVCNGGEQCVDRYGSGCSDCGPCPPQCGDGVCDPGEFCDMDCGCTPQNGQVVCQEM